MGKKNILYARIFLSLLVTYMKCLFIYLFIYSFILLDAENATIMLTKPRTVHSALTLRPEVNLLTEFAVIATSPQSPLVREVSGENADARRREDDTPPPQLVDLKQMVCDRGQERERHMPNLSQFLFMITNLAVGVIRMQGKLGL